MSFYWDGACFCAPGTNGLNFSFFGSLIAEFPPPLLGSTTVAYKSPQPVTYGTLLATGYLSYCFFAPWPPLFFGVYLL
jgi:hypothetical protein